MLKCSSALRIGLNQSVFRTVSIGIGQVNNQLDLNTKRLPWSVSPLMTITMMSTTVFAGAQRQLSREPLDKA